MTVFGLLWLVLTALVLGFEGYALRSDRAGDTLSEQVWGMARQSRAAVAAVTSTLVWLLWHFIVEPRFFPGLHLTTFVDDSLIAGAAGALGWVFGPIKGAGRPE